MTKSPFLVGLGLGLVAAVVFLSATTGPLLVRFILFFLTPLPIVLAGLGWEWRTAALAGCTGAALITLIAGPYAALPFVFGQVVPVVLLVHLAGLSRTVPGGAPQSPRLEWYPPGRIVIWAALLAGALALASIALIGGDLEELRKTLGEFLEKTVEETMPKAPGGPALDESDMKSLTDITLSLLPAATAMSWMASLLFNLWLGGRVTLASGQLRRPWPDLAAIEYPRGTSFILAGALIASLASGYLGLAASGFAGAFFLAYVLLGLAIIHYTTRGFPWRPFALWALYAALLFVNVWIAVVIAVLGLSDTLLALRQRYPPPSLPPT